MEPTGSPSVGDAALVDAIAHTRVAQCYQCGKCTAGCPVAGRMDVQPNILIRYVQLGQAEKAMRARAAWQCVSCQTCSARCPKGVDCAAVMDALRELALARGTVAAESMDIAQFQQVFLDNIRRNGRLDEIELAAAFKPKSFLRNRSLALLMQEVPLAPGLIKRGKFHVRGERVRDRAVLGRIFARCKGGNA